MPPGTEATWQRVKQRRSQCPCFCCCALSKSSALLRSSGWPICGCRNVQYSALRIKVRDRETGPAPLLHGEECFIVS